MLIIKELQIHGILSRSELAKKLCLSNPSISKNIDDLIKRGILIEVGSAITGVGRRPVMLKINSGRGCVASVDLSHSENVKICLSDFNGTFFDVVKLNGIHTVDENSIKTVFNSLKALLKRFSAKCGELLCICVGCPGVIDPKSGRIIYAAQVVDYKSINLKECFENEFSVPVIIKNDINLAVNGEKYYGRGTGCRNMMYVNVGRGLGSGIIINNRLVEGCHGYAGELGQWTVGGHSDKTVNSTFSKAISYKAVLENIKKRFDLNEKTVLRDMVDGSEQINFEYIKTAVALEDELCCEEIAKAADMLAWLLVCVNKLLDLELIVIGGIVTELGDFYLNRIKDQLAKCADYNMAEVVFSELDNLAIIYGGVQKAIRFSFDKLLKQH